MFFNWPTAWVQVFLLVVFRVAAILTAMPVLGSRAFPARARLGLALLLSFLLMPVIPFTAFPTPIGLWDWAGLVIHEVMLGLLMGFAAQIPIFAMQAAGDLIGLQVGFSIASVFDPESGNQENLLGNLMRHTALLLFLVFGGHHIVLTALANSFQALPPGGLRLSPDLMSEGIRISGHLLDLSLKLVAPTMAALLLTEMGLGLVARTVPQINIFIESFPLKIGLGLLMLAVALPSMAILFRQEIGLLAETLGRLAAP